MKRVVVVVGFGRHELMGNIICKVYLTKVVRIEVPSCSFTFHSCSGGSRCAIWFLFMLL
ncbi:hypothetical protein BDA96_10G272900 [Sorghum bicolor]|uniref:Uncharacterized protein n=1 Tax=Sorghum bicolor TaxID=4558 RepID=A0A921Q7K9_SORBI|nr:hypothetical protein BDA96_10G272900 [Sorghum bicolor]